MAVDIVVIRDLGDKPGPDIVDGLLSSIPVAILRGTTEINDSEPINTVTLSSKYRDGVAPGQLIEVMDAMQGKVWKGKIVEVSHYLKSAELWSDLEIEKPLRYNP